MVASTHDLTFVGDRVVKRYRSWDRGEPEREWSGLTLLYRYAPGTSPRPLRRRSEDGVPVIEMDRVPGVPLGAMRLSPAQVDALAQVLRRLYWSVPGADLAPLPERNWVGRERATALPALVR